MSVSSNYINIVTIYLLQDPCQKKRTHSSDFTASSNILVIHLNLNQQIKYNVSKLALTCLF